ncbi:hypothetical protein BCR44DRAFT_47651 [Catenaria anguillulae PL171]|uniref:Uncharacterized protein n=1 Tax=Catenaria anguillulae PL171 TaxID=765915 RepID=A0A1Y2HKZ5_9FUNG|nr:hypothetical protein BCR44DRAFT_47651 [Catenaria anguillulae PL171]
MDVDPPQSVPLPSPTTTLPLLPPPQPQGPRPRAFSLPDIDRLLVGAGQLAPMPLAPSPPPPLLPQGQEQTAPIRKRVSEKAGINPNAPTASKRANVEWQDPHAVTASQLLKHLLAQAEAEVPEAKRHLVSDEYVDKLACGIGGYDYDEEDTIVGMIQFTKLLMVDQCLHPLASKAKGSGFQAIAFNDLHKFNCRNTYEAICAFLAALSDVKRDMLRLGLEMAVSSPKVGASSVRG